MIIVSETFDEERESDTVQNVISVPYDKICDAVEHTLHNYDSIYEKLYGEKTFDEEDMNRHSLLKKFVSDMET